jgi:CRP-like cAMP-binding protein
MRIRDTSEVLAAHPLFAGFGEADLALIAGCGTNVRFRAGEVVAEEGADADTFYLVRRGRIAIETHAPHRPAIVVATHPAGDVVGWSWILPPHRWAFDARAVEDTGAIALDGACLRGKCEQDTDLGYRLMRRFARLASDDLQATRMQLLDVYGAPAGSHAGR